MGIAINWKVLSLLVRNDYSTYESMVVRVEWNCIAKYYNDNGILVGQGAIQGETFLGPPSGSFVPYDQLTESQILSWAHQIMGNKVAEFEILATRHAIARISSEENLVNAPLPWVVN